MSTLTAVFNTAGMTPEQIESLEAAVVAQACDSHEYPDTTVYEYQGLLCACVSNFEVVAIEVRS
jgi:hypothetical protein